MGAGYLGCGLRGLVRPVLQGDPEVIALASGAPLWLALVMVVVGAAGVVLDARRHEHRTGER